MKQKFFGLVLSAAAACLMTGVATAQSEDINSPEDGMVTSQPINDHALRGELTTFMHEDGTVAAIIFTSSKSGQVVALPKTSIDLLNQSLPKSGAATPAAVGTGTTVTWLRDLPGGGSVYEVSSRGVGLGLLIVQPNGTVTYVAY